MLDLYSTILREMVEPKLLMHGGTEKITKFDPSKIQGGARATLGYGVYFSDSVYKAKDYGPVLTYLDPSKLNILDTREPVDDKFADSVEELSKNSEDTFQSAFYHMIAGFLKELKGKNIDEARKTIMQKFKHNKDESWAHMLIKLGYDATKDGYEYVVFNFPKADKAIVEKD